MYTSLNNDQNKFVSICWKFELANWNKYRRLIDIKLLPQDIYLNYNTDQIDNLIDEFVILKNSN